MHEQVACPSPLLSFWQKFVVKISLASSYSDPFQVVADSYASHCVVRFIFRLCAAKGAGVGAQAVFRTNPPVYLQCLDIFFGVWCKTLGPTKCDFFWLSLLR